MGKNEKPFLLTKLYSKNNMIGDTYIIASTALCRGFPLKIHYTYVVN